MQQAPFDVIGLTAAEKESFQETYDRLSQKFDFQLEANFNFDFNEFSIFKEYEDYHIRDAFKILNSNSYAHLTFTEIWYSLTGGRSGHINGNEYQIWGIAYLNYSYGNILVQPETLYLKLQELVEPKEIDFEDDKKFSKRFYLLASNKGMAVQFFKPDVRNLFMSLKGNDYFVEIKGHKLIIGNKKTVSPEYGLEIANFISKVSEMQL